MCAADAMSATRGQHSSFSLCHCCCVSLKELQSELAAAWFRQSSTFTHRCDPEEVWTEHFRRTLQSRTWACIVPETGIRVLLSAPTEPPSWAPGFFWILQHSDALWLSSCLHRNLQDSLLPHVFHSETLFWMWIISVRRSAASEPCMCSSSWVLKLHRQLQSFRAASFSDFPLSLALWLWCCCCCCRKTSSCRKTLQRLTERGWRQQMKLLQTDSWWNWSTFYILVPDVLQNPSELESLPQYSSTLVRTACGS